MQPLSQLSRPAKQLSKVDLPTPESPTMAINSPGWTLNVTLVKTLLAP